MSWSLVVSVCSYNGISVGGHLVEMFVGRLFRLGAPFLVGLRSIVLRSRSALWSEPRSIAFVDSQSAVVFQNRWLTNM